MGSWCRHTPRGVALSNNFCSVHETAERCNERYDQMVLAEFDVTDLGLRTGVGGSGVLRTATAMDTRSEHRWVRKADETEWHAVKGPELGMRTPVCGAVPFLAGPGEARLAITAGSTFGPVCEHCSALERGLN